MKKSDLTPTQLAALLHAADTNLERVRGGYTNPRRGEVFTVRSVNMIERYGLIEFTRDRGVACITTKGRALLESSARHAA